MNPPLPSPRRALILSHPGHELRVLGWLKAARPLVIVLTDGAGHTGSPRVELSRTLIAEAGGEIAEMFGGCADRQIYKAILAADVPFFLRLRDQVISLLTEHRIEMVAGDSIEGYNPSHDLCRCLIDVSVRELEKTSRQRLGNYEFPLMAHPAAWSKRPEAVCHRLSDSDRRWKLEKIRSYAGTVGGKLLAEVETSLAQFGEEVLAEEWLSPAASARDLVRFEDTPPYYETYGIEQVAAGHYRDTIRFRQHLLPITAALGMNKAA